MAKILDQAIDEEAKDNIETFENKIESEMDFDSNFFGGALAFEWVDEIEAACPFIDNVVRKPKLTLVREENIVKVEKSKKITVASIKDLSRHTNFISKVDKQTQEVQPSKILDVRNEETYNIYENRFLYTLINDLNKFLMRKEDQLNDLKINNNKNLSYNANTSTNTQKINIELKITSNELPKDNKLNKLDSEIDKIKARIKRIREYITSWQRSEMVKALDKAHVSFINPPVKKTNIILKNPNFQVAVKLWDYLLKYEYTHKDTNKNNEKSNGNQMLKGFLDHSFLVDFLVLDSMASTKKEQKERISKYAVLMITEEIHQVMSLLLNSGVKITDEELLKLIAIEIKNDRRDRLNGASDVKKKFKNAMEEYIGRTQDFL